MPGRARLLGGAKLLEDLGHVLFRNPLARVRHPHDKLVASLEGSYLNPSALGEAGRVHQQVQQHLTDAQPIDPELGQAFGHLDPELQSLGDDVVANHIRGLRDE